MNSEITAALIGVGATITGTILGCLLNNLSNRGKLNIYISSFDDSFEHRVNGVMTPCYNREQAKHYFYKVSFDLYNCSGCTKIMRDIQIVFNDGQNDIKKYTPVDNATKRHVHPTDYYQKVGPINIPPKIITKLELHDGIYNEDGELDFIWKAKKVYLIYSDEKDRTQRVLIKADDYENYFNNHKREDKVNG